MFIVTNIQMHIVFFFSQNIYRIRGETYLASRAAPSPPSNNSATHRNPKLMVQHGAEGISRFIQYDQLTYFEDLETGICNDLTIWEAIIGRVGEVLKEQIISGFSPQERVKIGYAEFMLRRYSVYLVVPSENIFSNLVVVLEQ